jgi:signal transduction histidine kinase
VRTGAGRLVPLAFVGASRLDWDVDVTGDGPWAEAWLSQRPQRLNRQLSGPQGSALVLPLVIGLRTFGVVGYETATRNLTAQDAVLAGEVAAETALRLETALLFDEVRDVATAEERRRVAREIHDGIAQELSYLGYFVDGLAAEARRRGIALAFHPGASDADLLADPEWLRQVVEGLVDNAFRHAAGATRVVVSLDATPAGAEIAVTDDGPGFPAGGDTLFERFSRAPERTGTPGFGIGLALARWIVEQHGGQIALGEPSRGRGARVVIRLPAERREAVA